MSSACNKLRRSADTAVLLTTDCGTASGWGYVVTDGNYEDLAVSMVRYDGAVGRYIFGHEIGHNLGLDHDKYRPKAGSQTCPNISLWYATFQLKSQ